MFSVIIPSYNNLNYLKICINSLKKNSSFNHEIIIHVNEGSDGTLRYIKENNFNYSYSDKNEGVCIAFNKAAKKATNKYIVLAHDDMYFCPNWDNIFKDEINQIEKGEDFFFSGTMVQPFESYIELDCGKTYEDFNEAKLLKELPKIKFNDYQGAHWQPSLIPLSTWNKVNGFSEEFSPGIGSDPDFNMKLWNIGVRIFKGLSKCRVYHFSSITLRKKTWNNGSRTFLLKWKISIKFFKKHYLKTNKKYEGPLKEPLINLNYLTELLICKIKYTIEKYVK